MIWPPQIDAELLKREWSWHELQEAIERDVFEAPQLFELIEGKIRFKPSKSPAYAACVSLALEQVRVVTSQGRHWRTQMPLIIGARDVLDPVLALVEGQPRDHFKRHPRRALWIIEIADQDLDFQREVKRSLYARNSVREHWLVDLKLRSIEVSTLPQPENNRYTGTRLCLSQEQISPLLAPQYSFSVAEILP